MSRRATQIMQPMLSIPPLPVCLIRDEIPVPPDYIAPAFAQDVVAEWRAGSLLASAGAYPTQSVLLDGPSGVGKSTAARWIAQQLSLPALSMLLSGAIDSYMGATGKSIESALRYAMSTKSVLILDELDAIAASRGSKNNDVGEIWRITNTFIQVLDHWHGVRRESLLVGTTNMADSIDGAIRRRFDLEVIMDLPSVSDLSKLARVPLPDSCRMSHAAMKRLILQAKRHSVMRGKDYAMTLLSLVDGALGVR